MAVEPPPATAPAAETFEAILARPAEQRAREFKYRFAQSIVFGLPVIALQRYGSALGWVESARWSGTLQLLLASWVMYIAAAGMLFEGLVSLRRTFSADLLIALAAVCLYVFSVWSIAHTLVRGNAWHRPRFDAAVILLAVWSGIRYLQLARR
jgi:cation transport ATPase